MNLYTQNRHVLVSGTDYRCQICNVLAHREGAELPVDPCKQLKTSEEECEGWPCNWAKISSLLSYDSDSSAVDWTSPIWADTCPVQGPLSRTSQMTVSLTTTHMLV